MDTETVEIGGLSHERRLEVIRDLLEQVVPGIRTIQCALEEADESSNLVYIAVAALGRLGWITEHTCLIAGFDGGSIVGTADYWHLGTTNVLSELRDETTKAAARRSRAAARPA